MIDNSTKLETSTEAPLLQNGCCAKFLIKQRKEIFVKKVSELLSGILYEKSRVVYDVHSDNFTMFIYFGKRNTNCLDAFFTGKSNYYFGSMDEKEIKEEMNFQEEYLKSECQRLSKFMIEDLIFHFGNEYTEYVKLRCF